MTDLVAIRATDVPANFDEQMRMARVVAASGLLPRHLRDEPANVLIILMAARTLNISAFQAMQGVVIIEGRLGMDASLMRALMIRAGHRVRVVERTEDRAVVEVQRTDRDEPYRAEFTWAEAQAAELTGKKNWRLWRKAMLVARATAIAFRDECADVACGVNYTPEELGASLNEDGTVRVDNAGKVVLDGEMVMPPGRDDIERWAQAIYSEELPSVVAAWEAVQARKATALRVPETAPVGLDGVGITLAELVAARILTEVREAADVEAVRELWRVAVLMGVMELTDEKGTQVHAALRARPGEIEAEAKRRAAQDAAAEDAPAETAGGEVIEVDLDDIERAEVIADPDTVAANLASWEEDGGAGDRA